jgi:MerR family transcriptional regulator, light-induced transcriptional regulator
MAPAGGHPGARTGRGSPGRRAHSPDATIQFGSGKEFKLATTARQRPNHAMLSIGALSRASGIPVTTLRTWESRYGYPQSCRKPSGHRLYPSSSVLRLRRIADALAAGHRAGEVLTASDAALQDMLQTLPVLPRVSARTFPVPAGGSRTPDLIEAVRRFDGADLSRRLCDVWTRFGPLDFCREAVAPLLVEVGREWAAGRLEIRHEHFVSERLADILRSLRLPYEDRAAGPLVVLATLPGEMHGLGLQMVALLVAVSGCRSCLLGTDVPTDQMAQVARDLRARAVAVSMSQASVRRAAGQQLVALREALPRRVALLAGGSGASVVSAASGITVMQDLDAIDGWARGLAASG